MAGDARVNRTTDQTAQGGGSGFKYLEKVEMYNFETDKPSTVADAVAALASEEAQALSGGQTLIPTLKARLAAPDTLVSLTGIAEMQGISEDGGALVIGWP